MPRNAEAVWKAPAHDTGVAMLHTAQPGYPNSPKMLTAVSQNSVREAQLPADAEENVKCGAPLAQQRWDLAKPEQNLSPFNADRKVTSLTL